MNRASAEACLGTTVFTLACLMTAACQHSRQPPVNEPTAVGQAPEGTPDGEGAPSAGQTPAVDAARIAAADKEPESWLTHGGNYQEQRHSRLNQVNATNVQRLGLAWFLDLDTNRGQEATPIIVDGVMYSTSAWSKVQAIDPRTGKLLWQYDPFVPGRVGVRACCDVVNRGVAVWQGRVYVGTLDGRLVALDAKTGKPAWSVQTVDPEKSYTITGAPRIIKGKVVIGNGGAEYGVRGYVSAYDANDGKLLWRFYTVPGNPQQPFEAPILEQAAKTWTGKWWELGGGGTVWDSMAYDPELDLLYIGVGNGSPWNPGFRSPEGGDNLFLSSIVALRPDTGQYVWHYQTTPGDGWDYTATQHIVLADLTIDGKPRKVLMQAPKNGFFYVLDRATGELLSAEAFAQVNWASGIDKKTGRPQINPEAFYWKTGKPWIAMPGPYGAHNWQPMAFNPETGLVYIPASSNMFPYVHDPTWKPVKIGFNVALFPPASATPDDPKVLAQALAVTRGFLQAWDPVAQKEVWKVEHPGFWNGGVLSTAGGLVFQGTAAGNFSAYDAKSGKRLWAFETQAGVLAAPVTYAVDGVQYLTVVVGWGGAAALSAGVAAQKGALAGNKSRVLTFRLDATGKLPTAEPPPVPQQAPPTRFGDQAKNQQGMALFHTHCMTCHGSSAVMAGGVLPDLRWSKALGSPERWNKIVLSGSHENQGMVGLSEVLSPEQSDAIRAYVVSRANDTFPGLPKKR
ncbi:MAG: PQQ-dependent dehydrogenase, methanol/ethanol family [Myxococcales bacterium]|nr:PQQ-dependent dehydrogenase, methanol/ethanol family [Myxococcales bacterium]MDD9971437.1 PQQ-dependent dehydrogenase, methanol/ethanol family [Myxococcales bacterium]